MTNKKTLIKTVSWEAFHMFVLAGILYAFTGEWEYASLGAILYIAIESAGYYIHERLWVKFGNDLSSNIIHFIPERDAGDFSAFLPAPAIKSVPEWYKHIKRNYESSHQDIQKDFRAKVMPNGTIKKCMPFLDSFTTGYMYTLPCDVKFDPETGIFGWNTDIAPVSAHDPRQVQGVDFGNGYFPAAYKWLNPNSMRTPKGWSCLITHPLNRLDLPFTTLSGVVDTDKHTQAINFPFVVKNGFDGVIPAGTPIAQIIPFKRNNWKSVFGKFNKHQYEKNKFNITKHIEDNYKKTVWEKKDYE